LASRILRFELWLHSKLRYFRSKKSKTVLVLSLLDFFWSQDRNFSKPQDCPKPRPRPQKKGLKTDLRTTPLYLMTKMI